MFVGHRARAVVEPDLVRHRVAVRPGDHVADLGAHRAPGRCRRPKRSTSVAPCSAHGAAGRRRRGPGGAWRLVARRGVVAAGAWCGVGLVPPAGGEQERRGDRVPGLEGWRRMSDPPGGTDGARHDSAAGRATRMVRRWAALGSSTPSSPGGSCSTRRARSRRRRASCATSATAGSSTTRTTPSRSGTGSSRRAGRPSLPAFDRRLDEVITLFATIDRLPHIRPLPLGGSRRTCRAASRPPGSSRSVRTGAWCSVAPATARSCSRPRRPGSTQAFAAAPA